MDNNTIAKAAVGTILIAAGTVLANKALQQAGKAVLTGKV